MVFQNPLFPYEVFKLFPSNETRSRTVHGRYFAPCMSPFNRDKSEYVAFESTCSQWSPPFDADGGPITWMLPPGVPAVPAYSSPKGCDGKGRKQPRQSCGYPYSLVMMDYHSTCTNPAHRCQPCRGEIAVKRQGPALVIGLTFWGWDHRPS